MKIDFSYKLFSPNFYWAKNVLNDESIRYAFFYGGSSSSKTYSIVQAIVIYTLMDGKNSLIFRKVNASIRKTIFNDFKNVISNLQLSDYFTIQDLKIKCTNGAIIDFLGMDDSEKVKGISTYQRIIFDEITEADIDDFKQLRKRMRGIKNQKFIGIFNPVDESHWLKKDVIDNLNLMTISNRIDNNPLTEVTEVQKADNYIFIRSTYLNNPFVSGPKDGGNWGFYDKATIDDYETDKVLDYNFYSIYALGNWGRLTTGGEYYKQFDRIKHVTKLELNSELPLHISIDENVNPYLPLTISQIDGTTIKVIDEILGKSPYNNINDVIKMFAEKYSTYKDKNIFVYGDATSRKSDARVESGYNLFGIIVSELEKHGFKYINVNVPNSNPSVAQSGRFMNSILAGLTEYKILINDTCYAAIEDFLYLKEDKDGGILKQKVKDKTTGITYEKYGHVSDSLRYLIIRYLQEDYNKTINKKSEFIEFNISFDDNVLAF